MAAFLVYHANMCRFVVSFTLPYLLNAPYAALHSKVGFIYGSMAFCALGFTFFFVPECKGKSLEEVDLMFKEHVPLRKFKTYKADEFLESAILKESGGIPDVEIVTVGGANSK